ncbi:hypothetical protein [Paraburkholderia rhizosphaerae]|uniref:hypothetical protein n=1 Tax=Paraburkholderia rhizosphaerae TaxID=480658 RepID=UPI00406BA502
MSASASFAVVWLPARFSAVPAIAISPPPELRPVAVTAPLADTERLPRSAIVPSPFTPAPSVPDEATLPALMLASCCAASTPLWISAPDVRALTFCCA